MLTIKEIFDICQEHDVLADLSYLDEYYGRYRYIIKLYYGRRKSCELLDSSEFESILADRESFVKYISNFLANVKEKEVTDENISNKIVDSSNVDDLDS